MGLNCIAAGAVLVAASVLGLGRAQATPYVTVDLSPYVDTSFGNLLGSTVAPLYPTGTSTGNTGVPFAIANTGAATNNGYGLNYWGGFLGVPNDHGVTLAITGLNIADVTTGYTLVNTTFGTLGDNPTIVTFKIGRQHPHLRPDRGHRRSRLQQRHLCQHDERHDNGRMVYQAGQR